MKTPSLLLACLGLAAAHAEAQTFVKVAPLPTARNLSGVRFTSATTGWITGEAHSCFKTADGGVTWTPVTIPGPTSEPLYSVEFVDSNLGFISGNSGTDYRDIYRTTDGGATWNQVTNFPLGGSWRQFDFVSSTTGFLGANGGLVRTSDAGVSWELRSGYPTCPVIYGVDFRDSSVGLACGYQSSSSQTGIFRTADGGQTWSLRFAGNSNDALFLTDTIAIASVSYTIYRSVDGGTTWQPTGANIPTGVADLERIDSNTVVGVSTGGDIWLSTDGGFTWSQRWVGEGDLPADWNARFTDTLHGHVVGQGGAIYATSDGGYTWSRLNQGIGRDWNAIVGVSDSKIVVAGHHGYVQVSEDAGAHWTPRILDGPVFGRDTAFSDMSLLPSGAILAVGHWGSVFRSPDGGTTWQNLNSSVNPSFYINGVKFTDSNNGWMVGWDYNTGDKFNVRRTTDGGFTWQPVPSTNIPGLDIDFVGNNGWILTTGAPFWRTTNGGSSWVEAQLALNEGATPSGSQMSWGTANIGYVCGWDGYLAKSTDAGASWQQILPQTGSFVYLGVLAIGPSEVWICGARQGGGNAVVRRSLDGGATWQSWSLPGQYTTPYRIARVGSAVYVVGYDGDVWKMDLGSPTFAPTRYAIVRGVYQSGALADLLGSDDAYLRAKAGPTLSASESPVTIEIEGVCPSASPAELRLVLEAKASTRPIGQRVEFWDYAAGRWVEVSSTSATSLDSTIEAIGANPARFVQSGTRAVKARLYWKPTGPILSSSWNASIDRAIWKTGP